MSEAPAPQFALAVEIERHIQWRVTPVLKFGAILGVLLGIALWPAIAPPARVHGLPADPDLEEAARELHGRVEFPSGGIRFTSSITGPLTATPAADLDPRLASAGLLVNRAKPRVGDDPRWHAASGALDLVRHRYAHAARHYRRALEAAPHYPEARIGLGVTLAQRGAIERDPLVTRRRLLEAIAQFAAVSAADPEYPVALYDRILLLDRVGRRAEARTLAADYLRLDPRGPWAERVRAIAGQGT